MNIISLFNSFVSHLNKILDNNLFLHGLEHPISNSTSLKYSLEDLAFEYKSYK